MSELLDNIRKVQEASGCSIMEGKKYLELADGDVEIAIAIAQEEKAKRPTPPPAPQPTYQQPTYQQPAPRPVQPAPRPQPQPNYQQRDNTQVFRFIRLGLYGLGGLLFLIAIILFTTTFAEGGLVATLALGKSDITGFDLVFDFGGYFGQGGDYIQEDCYGMVMFIPFILCVAFCLSSFLGMTNTRRRNPGMVVGVIAGVIIIVINSFCLDICFGPDASYFDLGSGATSSGILALLGGISTAAGGFLPSSN